FDAADLLTASSEEELAELGAHAATILSPGVDHSLFAPGDRAAARRCLGLGAEQLLLYVGRIQRLKGLELALRALALLRPAPLLLVAGGPSGADGEREIERLLRLARSLHVEPRVRFLGPKLRRELPF